MDTLIALLSTVCNPSGKKKTLGNYKYTTSEVSLPDIPFEILINILSRLEIEDICRCKTLCKRFYNIIKEPYFIDMQANKATSRSTRLLFLPTFSLESLILVSGEEDHKWKGREIPLPSLDNDWRYVDSCKEFLCFASRDSIAICNPFTSDMKKISNHREIDWMIRSYVYGFGYDSTTKKYKVLQVSNTVRDNLAYNTRSWILTLGENGSWRELEFPFDIRCSKRVKARFIEGSFYIVYGFHQILRLDLNTMRFDAIHVPPSIFTWGATNLFLCNIQGSSAITTLTRDFGFKTWIHSQGKWSSNCFGAVSFSIIGRLFYLYLHKRFKILGVLRNGTMFLRNTKTNHLFCYTPMNKKLWMIKPSGLPLNFRTASCVPTLTSPGAKI